VAPLISPKSLIRLRWYILCFIQYSSYMAMTVYRCLYGLAPPYLADDCVLVSSVASRRHLRSADTRKLVVRRTQTVLGARDLAVCCAVVWNRSASLVTDCCDVCQTLKSSIVSSYKLAHLRTVYFALYKMNTLVTLHYATLHYIFSCI